MKTAITLITVFILASFSSLQANDLSKVLSKVADGIKPEAFTDQFKESKDDWSKQTKSLDASDMEASKSQVSSLINGLNSDALDSGTKESLLGTLDGAANVSDIGNVLSTLLDNMDPSFLTKGLASSKDTLFKGLADL
jgi:hypothetical protein